MPYLMSKERVTCISVVKKFASAHTKEFINAQGGLWFIEANTARREHHHYRSHQDFLSGDGQTIWQVANAIEHMKAAIAKVSRKTTSMNIL